MLPWSIPGMDGMGFFGAGAVVGFGAGFRADVAAGFFVDTRGDFAEVARPDAGDDVAVDRDVDLESAGAAEGRAPSLCDGMVMPGIAPIAGVAPAAEGTRASMPRSTGSVIARSRITGSAIMRAWIAMTSAEALSGLVELAIDMPVAPMAEWSIAGMLPIGMLPIGMLAIGMLPIGMLPMD